MPRHRSVQYPVAIYHLMGRGDRREDIFLDDAGRQALSDPKRGFPPAPSRIAGTSARQAAGHDTRAACATQRPTKVARGFSASASEEPVPLWEGRSQWMECESVNG
jgi:hypothetical protein